MDVRFQLLGPVRLVVDGEPVAIGGAGSRGLLAILALNANRVVTLEHLIDTLWEHDPPATARTIVHGNVSALRRALHRAQQGGVRTGKQSGHGAVRVETAPLGYQLTVDPELVDAHHARTLFERARTTALPHRAELLREALALWRGPVLAGVPRSVATRDLDELWRTVHGARVDAELELGGHAELVAELRSLVADNPAAERTVGQLMRALYYSGRRADALAVYRRTAEHISAELGLDPGPELSDLHERLLHDHMPGRAEPAEGVSASWPHGVPAQLPAAVPNLAGRRADLDWLDAMRSAADRGLATVGVLTGTAGIGKSALMVAWAHRAAASFPDGVLFASLHGAEAGRDPLAPADVLHQFLRGLGVPAGDLPDATHERVALYRSLLSSRTVLVLLDDAHRAEQLRPLLPPGGRCMTVITSRSRMDDLAVSHAARHRVLGTLAPQDATRLIDEVAGPESGGRNALVARLCGNLPLALRLASARLAAGAQWSVDDLIGELENEHTRLAALDVPGAETSVRAALDVSYRGLPGELAETFVRIGVLTVDSIGPHHLAVVCAVDVGTARRRLRELAAHHLLGETARDVFTAHDLVRLYARELARARLSDAQRHEVLDASLRFYLCACDTARRRLLRIVDPLDFSDSPAADAVPQLDGFDVAARWYEGEWTNVLSTVQHAVAARCYERAWQLARIAHTYRVVHPWWEQWNRLIELGLRAAQQAGSELGKYWMFISRCAAALTFGFADRSLTDGEQASQLATELGDDRLGISASIHVGCALLLSERRDESISTLRRVLAETERLDDPALRGQALNNCAEAEKQAGLLTEAIAHQLAALEIDRTLGDESYVVVSLNNLAEMYLATGSLATAKRYAHESVELAAAHGIALQEGVSRRTLGRILRGADDGQEAYAQLSRALTLHERVGSREAEDIRDELETLSRPRT